MRCDDGLGNLPGERDHALKERPTGGNDYTGSSVPIRDCNSFRVQDFLR